MFRIGMLRKPASLLVLGSVGLVACKFLYHEYQRRSALNHDHDSDDSDLSCSEARGSDPTQRDSLVPSDAAQSDAFDRDHDKQDANSETQNEEQYNDDPAEDFEAVLNNLDLPRLASLVTALRIAQLSATSQQSLSEEQLFEATCTISKPTFGSYNVAYEIIFKDGLKWFARVPGHGARFEDLDVQKMNSEYHTMRYIKANIDFPLPDVIHWTTSPDQVGAPFGIISAADGRPLSHEWYTMPEEKRFAVLTDIARHMSKLHKLSFGQIGSLTFSDDVMPLEVGPCLQIGSNVLGMLNDNNEVSMEFEAWPKTVPSGPWSSSLEAYYSRIEEVVNPESHPRSHAQAPLLRMLIETMPKELLNEQQFHFNKPDFALQNVFVDADGLVTSFIDWDRASCENSIGGYATLPLWLCLNWNPNLYDHEPGREAGKYNDPSPEELFRCRQHYSQAMAEALEDCVDYDPRMTKLAYIAYAVDAAIGDQHDRGGIINNFLKKAKVPFAMHEYCTDFVNGDTTDKDVLIREYFTKAWEAGWDTAVPPVEVVDRAEEESGSYSSEGSVVLFEAVPEVSRDRESHNEE